MNKKLLKTKMKAKKITTRALAKKAKILRFVLYLKLWGVAEFTLGEMIRVSQVLELSQNNIAQIFFGTEFPLGNK